MAQILGLKSLVAKLQAKMAKVQAEKASVSVGYTQSYSIYVHENLEAHHPVGQAKFLEQPAREMREEIAGIVAYALQNGKTVAQSLLLGGLALQRASQLLCPVDTGALKNSAFTSLDVVPVV